MSLKKYFLLFIIFLVTTLMGLNYFKSNKIKTSIIDVLDTSLGDSESGKALAVFESKLSKRVIITISGENFTSLKRYTEMIVSALKSESIFNEISYKSTGDSEFTTFSYYFKYRKNLLTREQMKIINEEGLESIEEEAMRKIYSPFFSSSSTFHKDPYLLMDDFYSNLKVLKNLKLKDGYFVAIEKESISVILNTSLKDKNYSAQALLIFKKIIEKYKNVKVNFSSLAFYEEKAKKEATNESNKYSLLSVVLILISFALFFKSLRHAAVGLTIILLNAVLGFYFTTIVMGEIHMITLLLSISVFGIITDYVIHYFMEEESSNAKDAFQKIRSPLLYSLITSVFGFIVFLFIPLTITRQFGVLAISMLICSFLSVKFLLPYFFIERKSSDFSSYNEIFYNSVKKMNLIKLLVIFLFAASIKMILTNNSKNNISTFSNRDIELQAHEKKIKKILGLDQEYEFFLISGKTKQELLKNEEELRSELKKRNIETNSLANWVPSISMQKKSQSVYDSISGKIRQFLAKMNVKNQSKIKDDSKSWSQKYIEIEDIKNRMIQDQWIGKVGENYYSTMFLFQTSKNEKLSILNSRNRVYINKVKRINSELNAMNNNILIGMMIFFLLGGLVLFLRFDFKSSCKMILPAILSSTISLGSSIFILEEINIFQLLGSVLILGLGLDYSFFYYFNRKDSKIVAKSVSLSTLTTLSSFGVLSLSSTKAVSSFGLVVLSGIIMCWLIVPIAAQENSYD